MSELWCFLGVSSPAGMDLLRSSDMNRDQRGNHHSSVEEDELDGLSSMLDLISLQALAL